jgi:hypothetical protein
MFRDTGDVGGWQPEASTVLLMDLTLPPGEKFMGWGIGDKWSACPA